MEPQSFSSIDEYVATFLPEVQTILEKVLATIRSAAPTATEAISYQIPALCVDPENGIIPRCGKQKQEATLA